MSTQVAALDFQRVFNSIPGLYIILLPDLTVAAVSDDYLRATMVTRADLVGRYLFDAFPENPDDPEAHGSAHIRESIEKVFRTGEPDVMPILKYDVQRPAGDGGGFEERFWKIATYPAFGDAADRVAYVIHRVEDVTEQVRLQRREAEQEKINRALKIEARQIESERRRATDALEDARLRLEAALEAGEIGTWTWDVVNNRVVADENLARFFAVSNEDANGGGIEKYTAAIHPDDRERVERLVGEALENADSYEAEYRLIKPDGALRWVVARGRILRDERGEACQLPGVVIDITDRKKSEEALRKSEQRLKFALDAGQLGSYELVLATGEMTCSERCLANFGLPADAEFPFEEFLSMIVPEDRERVRRAIEEAIANRTEYEIEYRITRGDGAPAWIFARGRGLYDERGSPLAMNGVTLDITGRKQTQERLQTSDERFRLVTRATNDAIWDWNLQTDEAWWNDGVGTLFGYAPGEVGKTSAWWYENIHPEDRERVVSGIHAVIDNGGEKWSDEYRFRCADGGYKYVFDRGFAIQADGKPVRMLGAMQDVTARRAAEEALIQSQERLQLVLDSSALGLWYCDLPFDVLNWSELTKNHFWLPPDAVVTIDDFYRLMHPEDREKTRFAIDKSIENRTHYDVEYRTVNPSDGRVKWIRAIGRGFYDKNNNPYRFDGITIDISDEKQIEVEREHLLVSEKNARREAENANRLKDDFLATLSHELRTPLSSILGWARMLKEREISEAQTRRAIDTIERNARAQAQLIDDILDVSRIVSGKLRLHVKPVDLASIIETAIEAVRPAADAKNIRLQRVLNSGAMISGDADRLQQIIWNLLSNAIKFTPKDGRVQVRLERVNSHVELTVADNGQGIDAETLPFIFERFRQSDSSTTRQHGGLGLGLAIVRHLVELHGGTVRAASRGLGQGAVFTVHFPIIPVLSENVSSGDTGELDPAATAPAEPVFGCPPELNDLRILLVDDEPDTRDLLAFVFRRCEALVTEAASVAEALAALEAGQFDVLVSDIGMPERDGYELIKNVRALPPARGGRIPAVALTAYARFEDRLKALSAGFQMHVPKPVEPAELLTIVAGLADWNKQK
ncbi:MAG TPA: PAS domain-containing protein [Pyrinomonadaceae bacterium]|jgi:PAS domain S-box-containing protein